VTDRIVELDSAEGARIVESLRGSGATVLLGSAVSCFAPTRLPAGKTIGKAIAERLADGCSSPRDALVAAVSQTAFEQVMERCPHPERVRAVLSQRFRSVPANPVHGAFARLAGRGTVAHIVTTNYDVGLEAAFQEERGAPPVALVRNDEEGRAARDAPHVLFKIHGCATPEFAPEMVFRLTEEAQLPEWKSGLLRRMVEGRPLLVAGYSGMDFEICPELSRLGADRVVWLHLGSLEDVTANAWRVLRESGGVLLRGDLTVLAAGLLGETEVSAKWDPGGAEFVDALFGQFDEEELDSWRARLFGAIGCGTDAVGAASRLLAAAERRDDMDARARALSLRAQGRFHLGHYKDAAHDYAGVAKITWRSGDLHELIIALNGVIETNRCAGRFDRAWLALNALRRLARRTRGTPEHRRVRADAVMLGVVFDGQAYQLAMLIPRWRGLRALRRSLRGVFRERARRGLAEVSVLAAASGNWMQFQQARLWARRYHLRWNGVYRGSTNPLPSREGYRQLGYVVARSMAIRDEKRAPGPEVLEAILPALVAIGAFPEAWKLMRFTERWLGPDAIPPELRASVNAGWAECQYAWWMRHFIQRGERRRVARTGR
jgi:hypothetical protein